MNIFRTIDLWTEPNPNNTECFCGAFIDGFDTGEIPFDSYKIVRNCNCIIDCNQSDINISNKHNAIVFYKDDTPVRLMVLDKETDIDKCIEVALNQSFLDKTLKDVFLVHSIKQYDINLNQVSIENNRDKSKEVDVGSCDRMSLLESMLEGSYTESDTGYGKSNSDVNYKFTTNISIEYKLITDTECFKIEHSCAYINENNTRIIPLQDNSSLDIESIKNNGIKRKI